MTNAVVSPAEKKLSDAKENQQPKQQSRQQNLTGKLAAYVDYLCQNLDQKPPFQTSGMVTRINGIVVEAVGLVLPIGASCFIRNRQDKKIHAEVVGFDGAVVYLMSSDSVQGVAAGDRIYPHFTQKHWRWESFNQSSKEERHRYALEQVVKHLPVGEELLGRVVDANAQPLDGKGDIAAREYRPLIAEPINPMKRKPIHQPLDVGVRSINALLSIGQGQRMGLMAGSGVGKSVLLGMMARYTEADITIVGLIGERGREVREFIEDILGESGLRRSIVVAAAADVSPLLRAQAANYATTLAEYFRDQGKRVLLIMDSLTRYAMAKREIALSIGEPPATKGYPPSVFAKISRLVERAGAGPEDGAFGGGSITAFYTVLAEGDDQQDPVVDSARSFLDGHIVLSRELADAGHYPAIDIEQSISRVAFSIISSDHTKLVRRFRQLFARYRQSRDLLLVGAYQKGSDAMLDQAVSLYPHFEAFLQQEVGQSSNWQESIESLARVLSR